MFKLKEGYKAHLDGTDEVDDKIINNFEEKFHQAINDDLNMPLALSVVWDVIKYPTKSKQIAKLLDRFDLVLGLDLSKPMNNFENKIPEEVNKLAEKRQTARINKEWNESDRLRDEILKLGYNIKDTKEGYEIIKG